jgi:hypothetical protein
VKFCVKFGKIAAKIHRMLLEALQQKQQPMNRINSSKVEELQQTMKGQADLQF